MTRTTSLGGIKYAGRTKGHRLALAKNGVFAANLSTALKNTPKIVLGAVAAESLSLVIEATKHDSSRAAANWDLAFSGQGMRSVLEPKKYGEAGKSWGTVGYRGDAGANAASVLSRKQAFYGMGSVRGGYWKQAFPGGLLYEKIGIGKLGTPPRVDLFNPILGTANPRRAGFGENRTGETYAFYAFGGQKTKVFFPEFQHLRSQIGNGFVPWLIIELNKKIKAATEAKRLIKL